MKIEKLNNNLGRRIAIGSICGVALLSVGILATSRAKYRVTDSIKIGEGVVNYKVPDFKVMAMYQQNDTGTYDEVTNMPTNGYTLNEEKTYCTTDNVNQVKGKITTENGKVVLQSLTKGDKCYLYFDKYVSITISDIITTNNPKETAPNFANIATGNEGAYKVADGMYGGYSYYWRGSVTNNYVSFAGYCWRIVRINGDGTIRLIYDGTTCHQNGVSTVESIAVPKQVYNSNSDRSEYVGWTYTVNSQRPSNTGTASNAKTQTETWYKTNITDKGFDEKVADGKFCNDRNTASRYTWASQPSNIFHYAAYERLLDAKTPTLNCANINDVYILKAGAITADEVVFAGGVLEKSNYSYYLYNGQRYWLMTPFFGASGGGAYLLYVEADGPIRYEYPHAIGGIRPVINLRSDTTFSGGNGTQSSPYIVN